MAKVKACVHCGEPFVAKHHQQQFCCKECAMNHRSKDDCTKLAGERRVQREAKRAAAERRRRMLARRDAEYAKLGTRVVVDCVKTTDGRTLVVENRGNVPIGFGAAAHISHN